MMLPISQLGRMGLLLMLHAWLTSLLRVSLKKHVYLLRLIRPLLQFHRLFQIQASLIVGCFLRLCL